MSNTKLIHPSFFYARRTGFIAFLIVLFVFSFFNSDLKAQGSGDRSAGEFLAIGVGGRPLGMGGAYVSLVSDVTAGYWNPGALSLMNYPQMSLMHDERFGNLVNYDYGSVAIPWGPESTWHQCYKAWCR